ncbi:MAG: Xanthine dehydrogenase, molybdenum binding subunit apoprotein [Gammaproteobacteria bacterium]|nr:Xanthine dehydrogenase, molybdenum binding subunit apoprotein [Gammaproteobacteria bacterium]
MLIGQRRAFGQSRRRREDASLLTGTAQYLADLIEPGMAVMRVIRSKHAHARLKRIDFGAVAHDAQCLGFMSAADLPPGLGVLPAMDLTESSAAIHHPVLVDEIARYAGQPIAIVLARDAYAADDLADRVKVDYEELAPVMDVEAALRAGAPLLYPDLGTNAVHETTQLVGDPDRAFADAVAVIEQHFAFPRVTASALEMRGAIARFEPETGRYLVQSSTQIPQLLRDELARITGLPREGVRVIAPTVGGGFGAKETIYPEEILVLLAAMRFGTAVCWTEDRAESFSATVHGREERLWVRAALDERGIVTAIEADCLADIGAAYALFSNTPGAAVATLRGPYRIPNFRARARSVITNKTPLNVYRGAGYPQATLAMERVMDLAAARIGLDRAEIRRRNLLQPGDFPVDRGVGYPGCGRIVFDSGNFPACLDSTLEAIEYSDFEARRATAAPGHALGLGLSFVVEMTQLGPAEPARLRFRSDGKLELLSGITPIGQGSETALVQILADHLGLPEEAIVFRAGDTDDAPDAPGTFASRGATMGGNAACAAGTAFVHKARTLLAELRGVSVENIVWEQGLLIERGGANAPITLQTLSHLALPAGIDAVERLDAHALFEDAGMSYASGCHAAVITIDLATGIVRVLDYAVTHDCGRLANPLLVDGQIMGGVVQGLGAALFEELLYDADGLPRARGFGEYVLPTAATAPRFVLRHIETPSPLNPLGMKGAGEAGCTGATAAIVNAVADALAPFGAAPAGCGPFSPAHVRELSRNLEPQEFSPC